MIHHSVYIFSKIVHVLSCAHSNMHDVQALFGPYRHVVEILGDSLLDAATSVLEPYLETLLHAVDTMPMGVDVDRSLLVSLA